MRIRRARRMAAHPSATAPTGGPGAAAPATAEGAATADGAAAPGRPGHGHQRQGVGRRHAPDRPERRGAHPAALSVVERTRELGLLRAVGLGRSATMRMVTVEAVVLAVFGALLGIAVGTGLGAAVVRALADQGIQTLTLPWADLGTYLLAAAVVGVAAAVVPAVRAARMDVLGVVAYE